MLSRKSNINIKNISNKYTIKPQTIRCFHIINNQNSIYTNMKSYDDLKYFGKNILNLDMNNMNDKIVRILWCDFEEVLSARFHKQLKLSIKDENDNNYFELEDICDRIYDV